jgi:segregation and condensation protein B
LVSWTSIEEKMGEQEEIKDTVDQTSVENLSEPTPVLTDAELEAAAVSKVESETKDKASAPEIPFEMEEMAFTSAVESILFAAERPVGFDRIREAFGTPAPSNAVILEAIEKIQLRYHDSDRGFELRKAQGGYHFVTKLENAEYIRRFQASKPFRLGRSALEVMAIIAYRQPITRAEIDQVRGIDSSHLLRTLIERGLVRMAGKAEVPGRPVQYASTEKFLETIGLSSTAELPPLSELNQLQGDVEDPQKKMEAGLDRFMQPIQSTDEACGTLEGEDGLDPVLNEIDGLIQTADGAPKEVFASAVHREVALANQEALEAFQSQSRKRPRKSKAATEETTKSVTFDELTGGNTDGAPPAVEN